MNLQPPGFRLFHRSRRDASKLKVHLLLKQVQCISDTDNVDKISFENPEVSSGKIPNDSTAVMVTSRGISLRALKIIDTLVFVRL